MNQKIIAEIGRTQRLQILNRIKRTSGLTVQELAGMLNMSYMGVKQLCQDLHKHGYLDTWRQPGGIGRPKMVYRLTRRTHELFPVTSNSLTIDLLRAAETLHGDIASGKLLYLAFREKTVRYEKRIRGETLLKRAKWLVRLRDHDGYMSGIEVVTPLQIVEHHSPILDLLTEYPVVARLEAEMFQNLLKVPVKREHTLHSGLYCCTFTVGD